MEDQENGENQNIREQSTAKQIADAGKQIAEQAVKDAIKKQGKKILIKLAPIIIKIVIAILIATIIVGGVLAVIDRVREIATKLSSSIATFIVAGDNGPIAPNPEEMMKIINIELEEAGIKKEDLYLGSSVQADLYLYKFMATALSTQLPYINDSKNIFDIDFGDIANIIVGSTIPTSVLNNIKKQFTENVQGIVKIKRRTGNDTIDLTYKKYDDLIELMEKGDTSSLKYFSIDADWMLCIAKLNKTTIKNPDGTTTVENTIEEVKIPYQTMISGYSVPFEFFIILQQISQNAEYVSAVADLVRKWRN